MGKEEKEKEEEEEEDKENNVKRTCKHRQTAVPPDRREPIPKIKLHCTLCIMYTQYQSVVPGGTPFYCIADFSWEKITWISHFLVAICKNLPLK